MLAATGTLVSRSCCNVSMPPSVLKRMVPIAAVLAMGVCLVGQPAAASAARKSFKKGMWGPVRVDGASQFPIYRKLGAGLYATRLRWNQVATTPPAHERDPADPAYSWPEGLDDAIREARRNHMRVAVEVQGAPGWSNGGREPNWAPDSARDFGRFLAAASRRYPYVRYWQIWAEPTRSANFMPLIAQESPTTKLDAARRAGVQRYAQLLDAAYRELKRVDRRDKVVGGNSFLGGEIGPLNFIRALKLPDGRPPRMDLYGHHPFTGRRPDLRKPPIRPGLADFSDLDTLAHWVDRYIGRKRGGKRIRLYIGEFALATDHANRNLSVHVSRRTQASWLRSALRIVRSWRRIDTFVYFSLYDQPPAADGYESNWGLLDWQGNPKPAFDAFARG